MPVDVTVVIPTRNRRMMLAQTLRTVLAQEVPLEVVVVDEASTDGTAAWIEGLRDPRIRLLRHERAKGLSAARNAGSAVATGRWVAFVDDDDLWLPHKLRTQIDAAEAQGAAWSFGGALDVTSEPRLLRCTIPDAASAQRLAEVNPVPGGGSNVLVSRRALARVGGFDAAVPIVADWDMWIRLGEISPPAVVNDLLLAYRIHPGNMSRDTEKMLAGMRHIDARYRTLRDGRPLDWEDAYRWVGAAALRAGDRRAARRIALSALRARHRGALRRLGRSLVPVSPRAPVADSPARPALLERVRPRPVVPWPPGVEDWLRNILADEATR